MLYQGGLIFHLDTSGCNAYQDMKQELNICSNLLEPYVLLQQRTYQEAEIMLLVFVLFM